MRAVMAFDSFKECMSAMDACNAAAEGLSLYHPNADVICVPLSDGGEGMTECISRVVDTSIVSVVVHGPMMEMVEARYAVSWDGTTAYMEMAAACGLSLVAAESRDPMVATSYGVGEMIVDAVERGCVRIVMGIGGSATCDGGMGMVEALRGRFPLGVEMIVASDVTNPLYGQDGAAYVFAPQKGATKEQVVKLDNRLRDFARYTEQQGFASEALWRHPGAGAAGGLGYALMAYLNAKLMPGIELMLDTVGFDRLIEGADFIVTGEGKTDRQTLSGKVPMGVLKRAMNRGVPVHVMSGVIEDIDELRAGGFCSLTSINEGDTRPISVLVTKEVAYENLRNACSQKLKDPS